MNLHVHGQLTREWAAEEGFSAQEAVTIARYNVAVDTIWPGRPWRNKPYHHLVWGGPRLADAYFARAVRDRSLAHLGVALHITQDVIGHGLIGSFVHWPWLDRFDSRSPALRMRLEERTREMMRAYRGGQPLGRFADAVDSVLPATPLPERDETRA